jgi:phosphoribosylanthranilate isomerase
MKGKPYIGITGFINPEQVTNTAAMFEKAGMPEGYTAMFGILTSPKHWKKGTQTDRFPDATNIEATLTAVPKWGLSTIHYGDGFERDFPNDPLELLKPLYDKGICKGVQLNMTRPTVSGVASLKEIMPELQIVYQLSQSESRIQDIEEVVSATKPYDAFVDYVLVDPSGGAGLSFDNRHGLTLMNALQSEMDATIGIAGGLSGDNVIEKTAIIQKEYTQQFFIDAEGQLLTREGFDMNKVNTYIQNSCKAFE